MYVLLPGNAYVAMEGEHTVRRYALPENMMSRRSPAKLKEYDVYGS